MPEFDDRLRLALEDLAATAERQMSPPGVPAAARRRHAGVAGAAAVAVLLAGGAGATWWELRAGTAGHVAGPACAPVEASTFLLHEAGPDTRDRVVELLRTSPEVTDLTFVGREAAYEQFRRFYRDSPDLVESVRPDTLPESFTFTVGCEHDYPAVRDRLRTVPDVVVLCGCEPAAPDRRVVSPTPTR